MPKITSLIFYKIMRILSSLALTGIVTFLISSCGPTYYVPNSQNVPLFTEQGQTHASARISGGLYQTGFEFQGAHAVSDKRAVMLNMHAINLENGGGGYFGEAGYGLYKQLGKRFVFETYGGLGYGSLNNLYYTEDGEREIKVNTDYLRLFAQPQIALTTKVIDFAFTSRFTYANFGQAPNIIGLPEYVQEQLQYIRDNQGNLFWEPGITLRLGWDYVKLEGQLLFSAPFTNNDLNADPINFNLGVTMKLPGKKK